MKIIDLLNKIANGEEVPKKIRIYGSIYEWQSISNTNVYHYFNIDTHERMGSDWKLDGRILNDEVEIIEENKKIEKIQTIGSKWYSEYIKQYFEDEEHYSPYDELLMNKLNEIIDEINKLKEGK